MHTYQFHIHVWIQEQIFNFQIPGEKEEKRKGRWVRSALILDSLDYIFMKWYYIISRKEKWKSNSRQIYANVTK